MAWIKVPPEHRPLFAAALPKDPRVTTMQMFGGVAAKANGHMFAGLFARSTVLSLSGPDLAEALALEGAAPFDPLGNGRIMSEKVMLPESLMDEPDELRAWITRAFRAAMARPPKHAALKKPTPRKSKAKPAASAKPAKARRKR